MQKSILHLHILFLAQTNNSLTSPNITMEARWFRCLYLKVRGRWLNFIESDEKDILLSTAEDYYLLLIEFGKGISVNQLSTYECLEDLSAGN